MFWGFWSPLYLAEHLCRWKKLQTIRCNYFHGIDKFLFLPLGHMFLDWRDESLRKRYANRWVYPHVDYGCDSSCFWVLNYELDCLAHLSVFKRIIDALICHPQEWASFTRIGIRNRKNKIGRKKEKSQRGRANVNSSIEWRTKKI
jgi:hypothetical protein